MSKDQKPYFNGEWWTFVKMQQIYQGKVLVLFITIYNIEKSTQIK